jgi:hypothetical protein
VSSIGPHLLGRIKDPTDTRDHPLSAHLGPATLLTAAKLPKSVPALELPLIDQGDTPHCVAFSGSYYRTAQERKDERRTLLWDETTFYRECKERDGIPNEDGTYVRVGCDVLTQLGALLRSSPGRLAPGGRSKRTLGPRPSSRSSSPSS